MKKECIKLKKELITYRDPKSPLSEIFRTLRTNIQFTNMNTMENVLKIVFMVI